MRRSGWFVVRALGLVVMVGFGQAVWRGLFDQGAPLLWGAFAWVPGGWDGQMLVIGAIAFIGLLIALVGNFNAARTSRTRDHAGAAGPSD